MDRTIRLLREIEREALDQRSDLAQTLRKAVALGGEVRSERLRTWASNELTGYTNDADIPPYRIVVAPLAVDGVAGFHQVTGQSISPSALPDVARGNITEEVRLAMPLAALVELLESPDKVTKMQPPGGADLVRLMNFDAGRPGQYIERLYWQVQRSAITSAVDGVRTALVELASEINAGTSDFDDDLVSSELVEQAVGVAVYGSGNRVEVGAVGVGVRQSPVRISRTRTGIGKERLAWLGVVGTLLSAVVALVAYVTGLVGT